MSEVRRCLKGLAMGVVLGLGACGDSTGPADQAGMAIRFATATPAAQQALSPSLGTQSSHSAESLVLTGTNGTLSIEDVRLIVSEFEVKHTERVEECDASGMQDACREIRLAPYFLDLPLTGSSALVASAELPAGSYSKLEFEIEDVEVDADDPEDAEEAQQIEQIFAQIRSEFADWPNKASMLVTGTFTPTGGEPVRFRAYFEAEIEVELEFVPALVLSEGAASRAVTVRVDPAQWFVLADGRVLDLTQYDYTATSRVVEFELEMEDGFSELEWDD